MSYSDRNYGAGDPNCPICKGIGYIRYDVPQEHNLFGKVFACDCRKGQLEVGQQSYLRRLGGLEHLADKTLAAFNPEGIGLAERHKQNLMRAYNQIQEYAQNPEGWLVITGTHGCGKTHLAAAVANAQIQEGRRVVFVSSPDLLDYLRSAFSASAEGDEPSSYSSRFEELRAAPLLVLDDLGTESPTPWASEKLYQILNYRYLSRLPTVITTSHHLEELEARVQSRLADIDLTQIVAITAPDYRGSGIGGRNSILKDIELYRNLTFDTFKVRRDLPASEQENLRKALEVARQYADTPDGWLILIGGYGTGKTHLAAAIANSQAERFDGVETLFLTVPDLLDHLRATFAPESRISYDKLFDEVRTARLLILDDLELSSATPWAREKLHQILNYRYHGHLPTIITSAHRLEEIADIDPRLAVRFRDQRLCKIVAVVVQPFLGERRKNEQSAR